MNKVLELVTLFEEDTKNAVDIYAQQATQMNINAFEYNRYQGKIEEAKISLTYLNTIKNAMLNLVEKQLTDCPTGKTNNEATKNLIIDCRPRPEGLDEKQDALDILFPNPQPYEDDKDA